MTEEIRSVVAAVIEKAGTYLICRRPQHKRHGGLWEFPGGKVEAGESLLDAARRELAEELALEATAEEGLLFSIVDESSGYMINFLRIRAAGQAKLLEHSELAWLTLEELSKRKLAPSDKKFVDYITGTPRQLP